MYTFLVEFEKLQNFFGITFCNNLDFVTIWISEIPFVVTPCSCEVEPCFLKCLPLILQEQKERDAGLRT